MKGVVVQGRKFQMNYENAAKLAEFFCENIDLLQVACYS